MTIDVYFAVSANSKISLTPLHKVVFKLQKFLKKIEIDYSLSSHQEIQ